MPIDTDRINRCIMTGELIARYNIEGNDSETTEYVEVDEIHPGDVRGSYVIHAEGKLFQVNNLPYLIGHLELFSQIALANFGKN